MSGKRKPSTWGTDPQETSSQLPPTTSQPSKAFISLRREDLSDALRCQILRLNLETKAWSGVGFYGNEKGKLKHPAGLLVDDVGNILVADNGRGSLCIFRESGVFFEELRLKEIRRPSDIIRQGRTLLVACGSLPSPFLKVLRLLLLGPWTIHRIKESEYLLHSSLSDPRA